MVLWPQSFVARAVAATMVSLFLAQALALALFFGLVLLPQTKRAAEVMAQTFLTVSTTLDRLPLAERSRVLTQLAQSDYLDIWTGTDPPNDPQRRPQLLERVYMQSLTEKLGNQADIEWRAGRSGRIWIRLGLGPDLNWVSVRRPDGPEPVYALLAAIALTLLLGLGTAVGVQRRLAGPLHRLADAAETLSPGAASSLPETGPSEIASVSRAFNAMTARLARHEHDRAIMLAGVSHDIRTPLAKLRLAVEMLATSDTELVRTAHRQIAEIDRTLGQFLTFARGLDGEAEIDFDLDALASEVVAFQAAEGVTVERQGTPVGLVRGRPEALRRAVINLIQNAVLYGQPPIVFKTGRSGATITLIVQDQGHGVPRETLSTLAQPFVRGDPARGSPGTGLGLAIAAATIEAQGGTLTLANLDPVGFEVRLEWLSN